MMRQFTPETWKRKQKEKEKMEKRLGKMQRQRIDLENKAKRGWRAVDISFLSLQLRRRIPQGFTQTIQVYLDRPLSYDEIDRRLDKAFGDLK